MKYTHKIKKLFINAGLEKEEYRKMIPIISEENMLLLSVFSQLAVVMFILLFVASFFSAGFASVNTDTYLTFAIIMLGILLCARFLLPKKPGLVMVFVYVFEIMLFVFGIHISLLHLEKPAVSAVAFLLVSPLLFYDRPIRLTFLIAIVVAIFCVLVVHVKNPDVIQSDVWNMITFGVVAVATTVFIMSIKMRALSQSRQIEYLSQTDLLTGAKNRNHYENRLMEYPEMCTSNLICVYADVNGLHEMNNTEGHQAGDRMLQEVARVMQQRFGTEDTYRIGGDEFVCFRVDGQLEKVSSEINKMSLELAKKGYFVSFGFATYEISQDEFDIYEIVKKAESNMFDAKRKYYHEMDIDRTNRQGKV